MQLSPPGSPPGVWANVIHNGCGVGTLTPRKRGDPIQQPQSMTPVLNVMNAPDPAPMPAPGAAPAPASPRGPATPSTPASATSSKGTATASTSKSTATSSLSPAASRLGSWCEDSPEDAQSQSLQVVQLAERAVPAPGSAESIDTRIAELRKQLDVAKEIENFIACFQYKEEIKMLEAMKKNRPSETGGRRAVCKGPPRMAVQPGHTWVWIASKTLKRALALLPKGGGSVVLRKHWLQDPLAGPVVLATNFRAAGTEGESIGEVLGKGALMITGGNLVAAVSRMTQREFVEVPLQESQNPSTLCQGRARPAACVHHRALVVTADVVKGLIARDPEKPVNVVFSQRLQDSDKDAWGRAR